MTAQELREKFLHFMEKKGHTIIPSASLIPENDSTLLFTNSGMFPLVPYFLGEKHPGGKRLTDSQKSFRTEDIEEVGDNRHNTFFEMLGNWSLGDYFKKDQLNWWFEFIIEDLKLNPKKIYQTVYAGDELIGVEKDIKSVEILKEIFKKYGVEAEEGKETLGSGEKGTGEEIDFEKQRIFAYRDKNWWQRGDAVGELGGPDSETFYDTGKKHNPKFGEHCHLNCDCGRFLEIGNSVFMQYKKTENGWEELPDKNVDFGGGLERISMILQSKDNIFETDLFLPIVSAIEDLSGKKYKENEKAFEIIADHLKAATFIMSEDAQVSPSNTDQGYIVRRLIRRSVRYGKQIGIEKNSWTHEISQKVREIYQGIYPELEKNTQFVDGELKKEEEKFQKTIKEGTRKIKKLIEEKKSIENSKYKQILSLETKEEKNILRDTYRRKEAEGFKKLGINISSQDIISATIDGKESFNLYQTFGFPIEMIIELAQENQLFVDIEGFNKEMKKHQELSRTASAGKFKGGLADTSVETTKLHTAAHLLLEALRRVLGEHVMQKGSNITGERLRFDFSHGEKMSDKQKQEVEKIVNEQIEKKLSVNCEEMTLAEAKKQGSMGVFESKYGEKVKVYTINDFSKEICGGPHVDNTGKLGHFKIKKEQSSSAGVRRIKAVLE